MREDTSILETKKITILNLMVTTPIDFCLRLKVTSLVSVNKHNLHLNIGN